MAAPLPCSLCKCRINLQDPYLSSKYCLLRKERIIDYIIGITSCAQFRQTSQPISEKKVQNVEEAIQAISQNVKAFQAVRYIKKEQSKLRKIFAVYRLSCLGFTTWEIAILLDETESRIKQHIGEAFKHACLKEESCSAKPFLSDYV
jgi:hypothetical protein